LEKEGYSNGHLFVDRKMRERERERREEKGEREKERQ
jgi:hypothetical protein